MLSISRYSRNSSLPVLWKLSSRWYANDCHYEILGVKRTATNDEIKAAFVALSKQLHPDRNADNPEMHEKFVRLNEAYSILIKDNSRRKYDQGGTASYQRPSHPNQYHAQSTVHYTTVEERMHAERVHWQTVVENQQWTEGKGVIETFPMALLGKIMAACLLAGIVVSVVVFQLGIYETDRYKEIERLKADMPPLEVQMNIANHRHVKKKDTEKT